MSSIVKWVLIGVLMSLTVSTIYFYHRSNKSKKNSIELRNVIDSLQTRVKSDSVLVASLAVVNEKCSHSALETVKYYDSKMKSIYNSLDKNRQIISDLEKRKQQIVSGEMSNKELVDYINKNY